jgi:V8-like Glu-specific endopeptidase
METARALPILDEHEAAKIESLLADPVPDEYSFNGIAALSGCSGSLVRFEGQSLDAKALVLTNGHCIRFMEATEVVFGEATNRSVRFFNDAHVKSPPYTATEIVYATMSETDMALLKLDATYQQIKDEADVDALVLARERGTIGEDIVVVSGFWEYVASCSLDGFVFSLHEAGWIFVDSLRYTQECKVFGGTSGSPVISVATGQVIGVNNTGNEGGEACSMNNPCEVTEDGTVTTIFDRGYGQQVYELYSCIDPSFEVDLSRNPIASVTPTPTWMRVKRRSSP